MPFNFHKIDTLWLPNIALNNADKSETNLQTFWRELARKKNFLKSYLFIYETYRMIDA